MSRELMIYLFVGAALLVAVCLVIERIVVYQRLRRLSNYSSEDTSKNEIGSWKRVRVFLLSGAIMRAILLNDSPENDDRVRFQKYKQYLNSDMRRKVMKRD